jgi:hypothetical protein
MRTENICSLFINGCNNEPKVKKKLCSKNIYVQRSSYAKQIAAQTHVGVRNNKVHTRTALGLISISKSSGIEKLFL